MDGAPQLRPGHFSAVITLCACSPRGPVAATEGSHTMMDIIFTEAPGQMANAADENLTYCSKTTGEMHNIL